MKQFYWKPLDEAGKVKKADIPEGSLYLVEEKTIFIPSVQFLASAIASGLIAAQDDWMANMEQDDSDC